MNVLRSTFWSKRYLDPRQMLNGILINKILNSKEKSRRAAMQWRGLHYLEEANL